MKRHLLVFLSLIAAITACDQKEEVTDKGGMDYLTFDVNLENEISTRAADVKRFVLAVFDKDGDPVDLFGGTNQLEQTEGKFELLMDVSLGYQCLFWADYGTIGSAYNYYNTSNMQAVTINKKAEGHEAFSGVLKTQQGTAYYSLTLKHAVARVDYVATDNVKDESVLEIAYSANYTSLNAFTGKPATGSGYDERSFDLTTTTNLLYSDYIFAPKGESALMDIDIKVNGKELATVTNVPHQVNYKSNIIGNYDTTETIDYIFNVTIDEEWNTTPSEHDNLVIKIANTDEAYLVNSMTVVNGNIKVGLNQIAETEIPLTFVFDPSLVDAYNSKNKTTYPTLSEDKIVVSEGAISKGEQNAEIAFSINLEDEETEASFLIPIVLDDSELGVISLDGEKVVYLIASKSLAGTYNLNVISKGRDGRNYGNKIWLASECARGSAWSAPMSRAQFGITADTGWDKGYAVLFTITEEAVEEYPNRRQIEIYTFLELLDTDGGTNRVWDNNSWYDTETGEIYLDFYGYESWFDQEYHEVVSLTPLN